MHTELISQVSKPLDRMINGHMAEAEQGFAMLKDVDGGTFVRFTEWAYKGYYTTAEYSKPIAPICKSPTSKMQDETEDVVVMDRHSPPRSESSTSDDGEESQDNEDEKEDKNITDVERGLIAAVDPTKRRRVCSKEDDIQPWKILAFENLQSQLAVFNLYDERTGDIVALLRYVYANTGDSAPGYEELRILMRYHNGCEMVTLMKDGDIKDLMIEDEGALLTIYMSIVAKRVRDDVL